MEEADARVAAVDPAAGRLRPRRNGRFDHEAGPSNVAGPSNAAEVEDGEMVGEEEEAQAGPAQAQGAQAQAAQAGPALAQGAQAQAAQAGPAQAQGAQVQAAQAGPAQAQGAQVQAAQAGPAHAPNVRNNPVIPRFDHTADARTQFHQRRRIFRALIRQYRRNRRGGHAGLRPDLAVMKRMNEDGISLHWGQVGPVPGVEVGDHFRYRSEVYVVGLHRQPQAGIDYIWQGDDQVATSVVLSGGYANDDRGNTITYSGQGGNFCSKDKRPVQDQEPVRGNLALLNSSRLDLAVRVIRGHEGRSNRISRYTYDGLYSVASHTYATTNSGSKVYKFRLLRLPGQPALPP
ncbi:YDG domain-containing protein At5g47150 [Physcomitrium patens]|uniref:YDG domain-containing protein n=1 Tax=Physcomitrium patens TaxID=3218 RepID=A0A2K1J9I1_PHYPA|nr:YDG domain-containing protein At5g47150-like [Physcomitrium patens]XP_024399416.1 YDG domain-containing protein At5g47150-like [Physcomitrium patens]XP_024399418.1 YDG domain-containing protein At5g47150-like [Physcomitrium patens]XP_024399419.1 YDG domain-containing protein At5g47150-like [Physcomitrium patens]XP_024399420.1 YDG domain-containing protein At5g47150-like [Physcomitrium patens]XP_024399421.1 YDG domain-containing protein At5g47150-like [Physcomitrium patens]PNR38186.1 hypoth|eukprot:XP_024399415.1 YDG domain-containing protein At5g47150-like [Physcomitrella patens]